ncbi:hypothetical protein KCMC57_up34900 [Kitasatospora sp. CMC57]|uniref:Secreted protein n=1 Tax=Kitasatospora sp. CMC57 TaxID=3231513 RepID=A0AB33K0I1_9ACTN
MRLGQLALRLGELFLHLLRLLEQLLHIGLATTREHGSLLYLCDYYLYDWLYDYGKLPVRAYVARAQRLW